MIHTYVSFNDFLIFFQVVWQRHPFMEAWLGPLLPVSSEFNSETCENAIVSGMRMAIPS
jgi:hypothetical protein